MGQEQIISHDMVAELRSGLRGDLRARRSNATCLTVPLWLSFFREVANLLQGLNYLSGLGNQVSMSIFTASMWFESRNPRTISGSLAWRALNSGSWPVTMSLQALASFPVDVSEAFPFVDPAFCRPCTKRVKAFDQLGRFWREGAGPRQCFGSLYECAP